MVLIFKNITHAMQLNQAPVLIAKCSSTYHNIGATAYDKWSTNYTLITRAPAVIVRQSF